MFGILGELFWFGGLVDPRSSGDLDRLVFCLDGCVAAQVRFNGLSAVTKSKQNCNNLADTMTVGNSFTQTAFPVLALFQVHQE